MADEVPVDESVDPGFIAPEDLPERIRVGDDPEPDDEPVETADEVPVTELTAEERAQFRSLMTIGKRTKKIFVFEHAIVIRSLNCDDEILVGLETRETQGTIAWTRAHQTATVAAAIQSVDGQPWATSLALEPDPQQLFADKLKKTRELHPLVVSMIYNELLGLDAEFGELVAKLGKL